MLADSSEFQDVEHLCRLFQRLEDFYFRWCNGEFIDAEDVNLPQIKKKQLREQLSEQENHLGLRQVDVCTGLNVMLVLLELHRYAQTRDDLKDKINFHPCCKPNTDQFDSHRLLRIIGYSNCLGAFAFDYYFGFFFSYADLSYADLSYAYLNGANLSFADLSFAGALEDFQAAVDSGALDYSNDVKQRRLRWIEALKSGNNPLTPEELEKLREAEG
ncbi:pentapeptide repeat-containing protein [Nostoc sp.]|uniref:pentapeptide repeat-containing protein n=1 Tax=Nostoc sp. TaxID=1180 RepID=UPI002FF5C71D